MANYQTGWHHEILCRYLDRFATGDIKRLLVSMPPRHGKSQLVSRHLPAYLLGRFPDTQIIACSYGADLASRMNRDVQRIIEAPTYQNIFPESKLFGRNVRATGSYMRNSDIFEIVGKQGSYRSAGVGGGIMGMGFNFGIIDDPVKNREEADSSTYREAVWEWYTSTFYSRRAQNAGILITLTRWNEDDLAGRLLKLAREDPMADQWTVLTFPAIATDEKHPDDPRQTGEALWPERFPLEELAKTRAASDYEWWALYQQDPRQQGTAEWPPEMFNGPGFWFDEWPDNLALKVMALDPSKGSDAKTSDYQALVFFGRADDGTEYIEADMGRRPLVASRSPNGTQLTDGMVEHVCREYKRFAPECLAVETNQFQQLLLVPFRQEANRTNVDMAFRSIDNRVNKQVRIRRLGEPLGQRRIRFKSNSPGTRILVDQLKQFPTSQHDDGGDAAEMARRTAIELWNGKQTKGPQRVRA